MVWGTSPARLSLCCYALMPFEPGLARFFVWTLAMASRNRRLHQRLQSTAQPIAGRTSASSVELSVAWPWPSAARRAARPGSPRSSPTPSTTSSSTTSRRLANDSPEQKNGLDGMYPISRSTGYVTTVGWMNDGRCFSNGQNVTPLPSMPAAKLRKRCSVQAARSARTDCLPEQRSTCPTDYSSEVMPTLQKSGWADSNRRPFDPQSNALTKLRYTPYCRTRVATEHDPSLIASPTR